MKAAVVYISLTGNTAAMAERIIARLSDKAEVDVFDLSQKDFASMDGYDVVAFGCPAMGNEVLEEDIYEPMFASIEGNLCGKRIILFGSYGWGGQSPQQVYDQLTACKAEALLPAIKLAYKPSAEQLDKLSDIIQAILRFE